MKPPVVDPITDEPVAPEQPIEPTPSERIYEAAKKLLGKHLTLNNAVPKELGCAEAVSYVLKEAGYTVPKKGIEGVNALISYMVQNGFVEVEKPEVGCIITSHRASLSDVNYAHTGVCMRYGIASNDSQSGHFAENYSYSGWLNYFNAHESITRYWKAVDNSFLS